MKSILSVVLAVLICFSTSIVFACSVVDAGAKILKSPSHIYTSIVEETPKSKVFMLSFVGGALKGIFYMGKDVATGLYNLIVSPAKMSRKSCCSI